MPWSASCGVDRPGRAGAAGGRLAGIGLLLAAGLACAAAPAAPAPAPPEACATVKALRAMAAGHFRAQRGAVLREGERFASQYRMEGAKACEITVDGPGSSTLSCEWFLHTGLAAQAQARAQFEAVVQGFQACVQDPQGVEIRPFKDGRGADAWLDDLAHGGLAGREQAVRITYQWFAPWWQLTVEYSRHDP